MSLVGGILLVAGALIAAAVYRAPVGYEDKNGFHFGRQFPPRYEKMFPMNIYALRGPHAVMRDVIGGHEVFEYVKVVEPRLPAQAISFPPLTIPIGFNDYPSYDEPYFGRADFPTVEELATEPHSLARARVPQPWGTKWADRFLWVTHKGKEIVLPREMATPHLFYALRMIYNHSVPPCFRVGEFKRYIDVPNWDPRYRAQAIRAFVAELTKRDDIICERHEEDLAHQLDDMIANTKVILRLGL